MKEDLLMEYIQNKNEWFYSRLLFSAPRRKVAKELGVHPSSVWRAIQRLKKSKRIKSYYSPGIASIYKLN